MGLQRRINISMHYINAWDFSFHREQKLYGSMDLMCKAGNSTSLYKRLELKLFSFFLLFWRSLIACESLFFSIASTLHFVFSSPNITTGSWTEPKKGNRASEYIRKICQDVTPIWWKTDSNRSGPFLGISLSVIKCTELIYTADWRLPLITNTTGAEGAKSSCDLLK